MKSHNPLNDMEPQHWLNQPSAADLQRSLSQCFSWAVVGWCAAAVFAGLFFWAICAL